MTLTQTAALTKKTILAFILFIMFSIILFTGFKIYKAYYYHPPIVLEQPTVKFGILPKPDIPQATSSANLQFSLDTQTGALPSFPRLIKVYFVPQLGTTLLAPEKIQSLAQSLGFQNGPNVTNTTQYSFTDNNGGTLSIDLNSANFQFNRPATDSAELLQPNLDNQDKIISDFKSYLSNKNLLPDDLSNGRGAVTYNSQDQNSSDEALVTLWPANLDNLEIETPLYTQGLISTTVTKATQENYKYITLNYFYWSPDPNSASTYPLKKIAEAYNELQKGQADVIELPNSSPISITQVSLAYLETKNYSPYIQPIYVFEGPNFAAYVPAIDSSYISK